MIRWCFAAQLGDDAGPWMFRSHGLNTANVGCSRDISLHSATGMGKHAEQWVVHQSLTNEQFVAQERPAWMHGALLPTLKVVVHENDQFSHVALAKTSGSTGSKWSHPPTRQRLWMLL